MKMCCTKKFLSELKRNPAKEDPEIDSFWSWHANIFNIERRKCVLVTNDITLFSLFIPGLKKPDFQSFNFIFGQQIFKNMLHEKIPQKQIEMILSECEDIQFKRTNNRSVLGSMNELKFQLECHIEAEGGLERTDIFELNHRLNRTLMSPLKYKHPIEMFLEKIQKA
jgi:hypothetical protein